MSKQKHYAIWLDCGRLLKDELRYLPKSTVEGVSGDEYLLFACLDRIRVELASFEVGEPQLGWSSLVTVRGA